MGGNDRNSPEVIEKRRALAGEVLRFIRSGLQEEPACAVVGLDRRTWQRWKKDPGKHGLNPWTIVSPVDEQEQEVDFNVAVEQAIAQFEMTHLLKVTSAKPWQAHMTILERKWPEKYGRRESVRLAGKLGISLTEIVTRSMAPPKSDAD